jgi:threonine dehydrogenase-like Zn-dependent dehydrogenase
MQELTVDEESDLVAVPRALGELAIFVEPLSVVEKAILRAFELHPGEPTTALVLGAGTIGLLAAMALKLRGLSVDVCSLEPSHSARARLVDQIGARYLQQPDRKADVVIEAAGAAAAATLAVQWVGPLGAVILLGAHRAEDLPLLPLILGNATIGGSVNASPQAFTQAVTDLSQMPARVLRQMVRAREWAEAESVILGAPRAEPKQLIRLPN